MLSTISRIIARVRRKTRKETAGPLAEIPRRITVRKARDLDDLDRFDNVLRFPRGNGGEWGN